MTAKINLLTIFFALLAAGFLAKILTKFIGKFMGKFMGKNSVEVRTKKRFQSSLPKHYGYCYFLWSLVFVLLVCGLPLSIVAKLALIVCFLVGNFLLLNWLFNKSFNPKKHLENLQIRALSITAGIGVLVTVLIISTIFLEALKFFKPVSWQEFLFGTTWQPQMAMNSEQEVGASSFGAIPVFVGSLLITTIAILVAFPVGIMAAIYLASYAKESTRNWLKPIIEILAGVPTVVYGYFAVIFMAPFFKKFFATIGLEISSESALAAGFVMGIMIIPFILSLADDAFNAVPRSLKDGALALGSTKSEMIIRVIIPTAMPSLISALILAVSRAIGETMIVVMAAGLVANLTFNPLNSVTTATAQIVSLLVGDQEFNSPKTLSAFALALVLFVATFILNLLALKISKNFEKKHG